MKCEDCLYFKRCVVLGVELDIKHNKEADKNCRHFKNKAEYAEVKHGYWIKRQKIYGIGYEYVCSVCEKGIRQYNEQPICSECGAKMDDQPPERS